MKINPFGMAWNPYQKEHIDVCNCESCHEGHDVEHNAKNRAIDFQCCVDQWEDKQNENRN